MTTFDEREKGFEAKYKRDQELQFKVTARRNKLLGLWIAEKFGLSVVAETMGSLFMVVKYLGALYLLWLGCSLLFLRNCL